MIRILAFISFMVFMMPSVFAKDAAMDAKKNVAVFAMGCFWCGEAAFRQETGEPLLGITSLRVGYAGGTKANPTYSDHEGYKEAVKVDFDPAIISYEALLKIFWENVDPLDGKGQFCDKGFPYTSVIFYTNEAQQKMAEDTKKKVGTVLHQNSVTEITPYTSFVDAEEYHQDYKHKNPLRYKFYRWNCGRDARLKAVNLTNLWKDTGENTHDTKSAP